MCCLVLVWRPEVGAFHVGSNGLRALRARVASLMFTSLRIGLAGNRWKSYCFSMRGRRGMLNKPCHSRSGGNGGHESDKANKFEGWGGSRPEKEQLTASGDRGSGKSTCLACGSRCQA